MEQTRQSKRRRVSPDPVFPSLHPVPVSSVPPTGTTQIHSSKRRRLNPDPDFSFLSLRPVSDISVLPKIQDAQQAPQAHQTNSKSNKGQNHQSKRRRLDPDPVFPTLLPCHTLWPKHGSPGPMTSRVQPQEARISPAANSLEGLPVELQLMVFNFLPDVDTLDALVHASPVHHRLFAYHPINHAISRLTILKHVAEYKVYNSILAIEKAYFSTRKAVNFEKAESPCMSSANVKYCEGHWF